MFNSWVFTLSGVAAVDKDGTVTPGAEPSAVLASAGIESVISGVGSSKNPDWLAIEDWKLLQVWLTFDMTDNSHMPIALEMASKTVVLNVVVHYDLPY